MRKIATLICLLASAPVSLIHAQNNATPSNTHYYHLEFVVKEVGEDGKPVNSRVYNTNVSSDNTLPIAEIRTGTKIPIKTDDKGSIQYLDLGVNIDCASVKETPDGVSVQIKAEISSLSKTMESSEPSSPIIRQNRWQGDPLLKLGKVTVIYSSDNLDNKGRMEVQVTATEIR